MGAAMASDGQPWRRAMLSNWPQTPRYRSPPGSCLTSRTVPGRGASSTDPEQTQSRLSPSMIPTPQGAGTRRAVAFNMADLP